MSLFFINKGVKENGLKFYLLSLLTKIAMLFDCLVYILTLGFIVSRISHPLIFYKYEAKWANEQKQYDERD